ncbi:hypothetical protein WBG78_28530 [Chryseolinea sp. T2]|uniref:hypothetical protein n=1 Tax=Chryseolinea sp. T2 TaxID=3129255 RepID=UPI0030780A3C
MQVEKMTFNGPALERAIELIERQIVDKIGKSNIGEVSIETRKTIHYKGSNHEIDIFVTVNLNIGVPHIYIFEAKNRQDKTDKNDIIIFEDKIDAANAQQGFFVSREYTSGAVGRAKESPRMTLLTVEETTELKPDELMNMQYLIRGDSKVTFVVFPTTEQALDNSQIITLTDGRNISLNDLVSEKYHGFHNKIPGNEEGNDVREVVKALNCEVIRFEVVKPKIDGVQYDYLGVDIYTPLSSQYPTLVYDFKVQERGRYFKIQSKDSSGKKLIEFEITKIDDTHYHFHKIDFQD